MCCTAGTIPLVEELKDDEPIEQKVAPMREYWAYEEYITSEADEEEALRHGLDFEPHEVTSGVQTPSTEPDEGMTVDEFLEQLRRFIS